MHPWINHDFYVYYDSMSFLIFETDILFNFLSMKFVKVFTVLALLTVPKVLTSTYSIKWGIIY